MTLDDDVFLAVLSTLSNVGHEACLAASQDGFSVGRAGGFVEQVPYCPKHQPELFDAWTVGWSKGITARPIKMTEGETLSNRKQKELVRRLDERWKEIVIKANGQDTQSET